MKCNDLKNQFPEMMKQCYDSFFHDGWYDLVFNLMADIQQLNTNVKVLQIKEKFGGLRFYVNSASEEIHELICKAEEKSEIICEFTGNQGKNRQIFGW